MLKSVQRAEDKRLLKYLSFQVRHGLSLEQALQNIGFRKEGAERKEILDDMEKNGVVPQEYMDETIRQNLELKKQLFTAKNERNAFKIYSDGAEADAIKLNEQLSEAKEIIQKLQICLEGHHTNSFEYEQIKQAEAFLSEVDK